MTSFQADFFGPFYLMNHIGTGGTSDIFLGILCSDFDSSAPKQSIYVIKRLLPHYSREVQFIENLTSEAKIASLLKHPNIVSISDLGNVGTDYYMSMEWINGKSLFDLFQEVERQNKNISRRYLLYICMEVSKALDFTHKAKDHAGRSLDIVHCDVSPQNILVSYSGKVKLTDFGIATAAKKKNNTSEKAMLGKIHYMAPELIQQKAFDHRADIYSFGVLLYESVTFQKPFQADSHIELQDRILSTDPSFDDSFFDQYPEFKTFLQACLHKDPSKRPSDLSVFTPIYQTCTSEKSIDRANIAKLMQHVFKTHIQHEKNKFKDNLKKYTSDLQSRPKPEHDSQPEGIKEIGRTSVIHKQENMHKTSMIQKEVSKESLGRIRLEKKQIIRKILPPVIKEENVSLNGSGKAQNIDPDAIDGAIDNDLFEVDTQTLSDDLFEIDESKMEYASDEVEHQTFVSKVAPIKKAPAQKTYERFEPTVQIPLHENNQNDSTRASDSFDMFDSVSMAIEPAGAKDDVSQEFLMDQATGSIEEMVAQKEDSPKTQVFFQRKDHVPVEAPNQHLPHDKMHVEFSDSIMPASSIAIQDPASIYRRNLWAKRISATLGVAACLLGLLFLAFKDKPPKLTAPMTHIDVLISIEPHASLLFKTSQTKLTQAWAKKVFLKPISDYLNSQHASFNKAELNLKLNLRAIEPSQSFSWKNTLFKRNRAYDYLHQLFEFDSEFKASKGTLFVHLYEITDQKKAYPFQYSEQSPPNQHLTFMAVNQDLKEAQVLLTNQILRLMGADILTNNKGQPIFPDGYAQPSNKPLHPQTKGEIMTLMIPQSPTESYLLEDLQAAIIGKTTAQHLKWIDQ